MTQQKPATFSPYNFAVKLKALAHESGINWSYAIFASKETTEAFAKACNENGYRTRSLHETAAHSWAVQYHHYAD